MKIPTKHINTKHTFMFAGALALAVVLAPAATFAHGGGDAKDGRFNNGNSRDGRDNNSRTDGVKTANKDNSDKNNRGGKHYNHGGNYDGQKWWGKFSPDQFQKIHDAKLAKFDATIAKNNLTVENGDALRAELVTNADSLRTDLAALEQLRASINKNALTDEQKAALKAQTLTTFESFYDYYESLYSFKAAIKAAADTNGAKVEVNVEKEN